jgi:hypothetical protein
LEEHEVVLPKRKPNPYAAKQQAIEEEALHQGLIPCIPEGPQPLQDED